MSASWRASLADTASELAAGTLSPVELTTAVLQRIHEVEPLVGAYETVCVDTALASARAAEEEIRRGTYRGPLHGVPIAVKDVCWTNDAPTTASSAVRRGHQPTQDSHCVALLRQAGAVLIGKARTHEFAGGFTTPGTRNPRDLARIPGGSSGGSAAAVAAGEAFAAIGTDTGGSIRVPSTLCGVTGLKPTFGRVSRFGTFPLAWSFDHVGPIGRDVTDTALVLQAIAGYDARDPGSLDVPVPDFSECLEQGVRGLRIGLPARHPADPIDPRVATETARTHRHLEQAGAELVPVDPLPFADLAVAIYWSMLMPEAAVYHRAEMQRDPARYTPDVRALLEVGDLVLAGDYVRGLRARTLMKQAWADLFGRHDLDAVLAPSLPITAPLIGDESVRWDDGTVEPLISVLCRNMVPANLCGLPALTVPCGTVDDRPVAVQIVGRPLAEATVLQIGRALEHALPRTSDFPLD